jgi:hypothetical protein
MKPGAVHIPVARYFGSATVYGQPAADGLPVTATIGGVACGFGRTSGGQYVLDIQPIQGCTTPGSTVSFTIQGNSAIPSGTLPSTPGTAIRLNLSVPFAGPS